MLVPFATISQPIRSWLTIGLLVVAVGCGYVLGRMAPPEAQPCVLYGSTQLPDRDWRFALLGLFNVPDSHDATWRCLPELDRARELALLLVDDLFALAYGGGFALLLMALSRRAGRDARMPGIVKNLLRFAAGCYPVAAVFDLIENQLIAVLLFLPRDGAGDMLILIVRYCAIPKYDLSLIVGPLVATLAGVVAFMSRIAHLMRAR